MLRLATVLAIGALVAVSTGFRQDPWVQQVRLQLDEVRKEMDLGGLELTHDPFIGSLNDQASEQLTVELEVGTEYYVIGVCDEDCTDVDLELFNGGTMIAQDIEADDYPVLLVKPTRSGTYRIDASMAACSAEPCRYGVGVYGS